MSDTFPTEVGQDEAALNALDPTLDTDAMLAELNELTNLSEEPKETETPEDPTDGEPAADPEETAAVTPPAASVPPGYIEFQGKHWPVEEVQAMLALNQRMKDEPELAQRVHGALSPTPAPQEAPAWLEHADEATVRLYEQQQQVSQQLAQMRAETQKRGDEERRAHVVDSFRTSVSDFKAAHPNLSDESVAQIADAMGRANIIEGLERSEGSLSAAFARGMELTLGGTPQFRSLITEDVGSNVNDDGKAKDRKVKQAALSPSGAPASRATQETERPKTREQLIDAMLADQRASLAE